MKKQWINIYEVCPQCKGTCWMDEQEDGMYFEGEPCLECKNGKISRLVEIDINRNSTQRSILINE